MTKMGFVIKSNSTSCCKYSPEDKKKVDECGPQMCNLVLFEKSKILLILVVNSPWPWHCFERLDSDNNNKKNAWSTHSEHSYFTVLIL